MSEVVDTVIIGAGHSGLALSYYLTQKNKTHIILEKGGIGESWRNKRWDSLTLVIPNYLTQLPGFYYKGDNPQGFDSKWQYIKYLEDYAKSFNAPVKENTEVKSLEKTDTGFLLKTNNGDFEAKNVIIATGPFQKQKIPVFAKDLPKNIKQIASTEYKNPSQLPEGAVLVVGSGNSGAQIAEELNKAGRKVYFSIGRFRKTPRRYRGEDLITWFERMGRLDQAVGSLPSPEAKKVLPIVFSGVDDGHEIDFYDLAEKGVILLGHISNIKGDILEIAPDLLENLQKGEEAYQNFKKAVDDFIEKEGLNAPEEEARLVKNKPEIEKLPELGLNENNISSVVWATGYEYDFGWVKVPQVFDEKGDPIHQRGISEVKGLFFLGLPWLHKYKSFFIYGAEEDSRYLSDFI